MCTLRADGCDNRVLHAALHVRFDCDCLPACSGLNFCITVVCHMLWYRCNPEFPWKLSLPTFVVAGSVVPALRVLIYERLNVPYIFASAAVTTERFKLTAMAAISCFYGLNMVVPYLVYCLSKQLSHGHRHFAAYGAIVIAFSLYVLYADYYVCIDVLRHRGWLAWHPQCQFTRPSSRCRCAGLSQAACPLSCVQEDEVIVQWASFAGIPWAALLWYDSRYTKNTAVRSNAYILLLAVCLVNIPQGVPLRTNFWSALHSVDGGGEGVVVTEQ